MADCPCPSEKPKINLPLASPILPKGLPASIPLNTDLPAGTPPRSPVMACPPVNIRPLTCDDQITICGFDSVVSVTGNVNIVNTPHVIVDSIIITEVEIKNDVGNPVPVSAVDLDIRNLTCATDSVTTCQAAVTASFSSVSQSTSNVTLLAANVNRKRAIFWNNSTANAWIKFGATASQTSFSIRLVTETFYELEFPYTGVVDGIWLTSGAGFMRITEFV